MSGLDLGAIEARANAAYAEVIRLCSGRDATWRMSIPANPARDSDLLISAALTDNTSLVARVRELEAKLAACDDELRLR